MISSAVMFSTQKTCTIDRGGELKESKRAFEINYTVGLHLFKIVKWLRKTRVFISVYNCRLDIVCTFHSNLGQLRGINNEPLTHLFCIY